LGRTNLLKSPWLTNFLFVYSGYKSIKIKVMLDKVKNKEIKILAIVGLIIVFSITGLFGLTFLAGCIVGDMLSDYLF